MHENTQHINKWRGRERETVCPSELQFWTLSVRACVGLCTRWCTCNIKPTHKHSLSLSLACYLFSPKFMNCIYFCVNWYLGQTTCNNGQGRVLYERLPNQQLQGFDDDVVRDTAPPFRVLEKCQDLCLRDRTASNNLVRACTSFDFQPGSRIASYSGSAEYEESTCYLTREQPAPEGIGILMLVPNSVHFTEICLACKWSRAYDDVNSVAFDTVLCVTFYFFGDFLPLII